MWLVKIHHLITHCYSYQYKFCMCTSEQDGSMTISLRPFDIVSLLLCCSCSGLFWEAKSLLLLSCLESADFISISGLTRFISCLSGCLTGSLTCFVDLGDRELEAATFLAKRAHRTCWQPNIIFTGSKSTTRRPCKTAAILEMYPRNPWVRTRRTNLPGPLSYEGGSFI